MSAASLLLGDNSDNVSSADVTVIILLRFVLNELIQTEKDYVKDLGIVVEVRHLLPVCA